MKARQTDLFENLDYEPLPETFPAAFLERPERIPNLKSIEIEALKCIDHLIIELQPSLTILTEPNNSGKSTILQAILLAFDCFRRCLNTNNWTLKSTGRAVSELDYLRVNQPRDLWYKKVWKPTRKRERYIRVSCLFDNDFKFTARIRFLFGALNIGLENVEQNPSSEVIKTIASSSPILIPASPGPQAHEPVVALAQLHNSLAIGDPASVLHNILLKLYNEKNNDSWDFTNKIVKRYFDFRLENIIFDEKIDLEIRTPYSEQDCSLDIVSAGSGLNQILQLAAIVAWRKPGIVLLDEPEAHLHTTIQMKVLDFLYELSNHYGIQIIISTHSRDLISQAPLQTIIPIDLSRKVLHPIESLEHLLLEYERQGVVSNVDLALLYQTKKCLFVEGDMDSKLIPKIANQLGYYLFQGRNQIVIFKFEGVDNLKLIPHVIELFQRMIGANLKWAVVRDRDANLPEIINLFKDQSRKLGIYNLHIWDGYSIENNLIRPQLLLEAIKSKNPDSFITIDIITTLLNKVTKLIETDVGRTYITKAQTSYRQFNKDNPFELGAHDALKFFNNIDLPDNKLKYFPGKKIFGKFVNLLQQQCNQTLRLDDIVKILNKDNAPQDFFNFFEMLLNI